MEGLKNVRQQYEKKIQEKLPKKVRFINEESPITLDQMKLIREKKVRFKSIQEKKLQHIINKEFQLLAKSIEELRQSNNTLYNFYFGPNAVLPLPKFEEGNLEASLEQLKEIRSVLNSQDEKYFQELELQITQKRKESLSKNLEDKSEENLSIDEEKNENSQDGSNIEQLQSLETSQYDQSALSQDINPQRVTKPSQQNIHHLEIQFSHKTDPQHRSSNIMQTANAFSSQTSPQYQFQEEDFPFQDTKEDNQEYNQDSHLENQSFQKQKYDELSQQEQLIEDQEQQQDYQY